MKAKTIKINLEFNGKCPACLLKNNESDMLLNCDDFFECPTCSLMVTCFPPFAAILLWKGRGNFRSSRDKASDYYSSLLLCEASTESGKEIFPNENELIEDSLDLEAYVSSIYGSYEEYLEDQFDPNAECLKQQEQYLQTIASEEWENLSELFKEVQKEGLNSQAFHLLHKQLYALKIIFAFPWVKWHQGKTALRQDSIQYSTLSLLEVSMYTTTVFREDRFSDRNIEHYFNNGTLSKLFQRLEELT